MEQVLALRPFLPAKAIMKLESVSFDPSGVLWHVAEAPF
jgi:hypothetical protein